MKKGLRSQRGIILFFVNNTLNDYGWSSCNDVTCFKYDRCVALLSKNEENLKVRVKMRLREQGNNVKSKNFNHFVED